MVHRRSVDGQEVVFGNQGDLFGNAMTWWDHETGSVWSQPLGEAILGPRTGERLELLGSQLTEWGAWRAAHPDTLALDAPGGSSGFSLERLSIVVEIGDEATAYPVRDLREVGVANDVVAGIPLAVVLDPENPDRWSVFGRKIDGRTVTLAGETLAPLPGFTAFERDFDTFWPDGRVWEPPTR